MKIFYFDLSKHNISILETEILYAIASARASNMDFVGFNITGEEVEKIKSTSLKVLRNAKKQEKIQLFLSSLELSTTTTEAQYLNNKYPDLVNSCSEAVETVFVKI